MQKLTADLTVLAGEQNFEVSFRGDIAEEIRGKCPPGLAILASLSETSGFARPRKYSDPGRSRQCRVHRRPIEIAAFIEELDMYR